MSRSYHILAKKSMFCLFLGVFLVMAPISWAKVPNDPDYQKDLYNQINAPVAWDQTTGSNDVIVAVIDTGTDLFHPDLNANIWKNPGEIAGNDKDDDNNGYVDDYYGWNFVENNNDVSARVDNTADEPGAVSHGTITAGLVGAIGDNNLDGVGVNWQVKIMPLRVLSNDGTGVEDNLVKAVNYAIDKHVDVINMSFVTDDYLPFAKEALRRAYDQGIVIVASAGNDGVHGQPDMNIDSKYPICLDSGDAENWIIGVTSVDSVDKRSFFADYGSCVDIVAPGQNIFSTERYVPSYGYSKEFGGPWQGNSFSAPLVAGAAALVKSERPDWSAPQIISALLNNTDNIDSTNPLLIGKLGHGRLNLGRAITFAMAGKPLIITQAPDNYVYSFKKDQILRDGILFAWIDQSKILAIEATDINNDGQREIVVLHEYNGFYFLRIFTADGVMWKEFSVGAVINKNILAKRLSIFSAGDGWNNVAVADWNQKKNTTSITQYNFDGEKVGQVKIKAKLADWNSDVDELTTVRVVNKKDITEYWSWAGKKL